MSKSLSFYNLTGGLNTVQDLATINSSPNRTESPDMMNIEYYKLGGIQTMKGNTQIGKSLINRVTCGFEYIVGNNSYMIVTTEDNKVYEYNKSTKTFIELGIVAYDESKENISQSATHPRHCMVGYNNGVVISNGYSLAYYNRTLQQKVGDTTRNFFFATKVPKLHPADANTSEIEFYPNCIASYKGRLFVGANTTTQDENNFTGSTAFYSGVGLGIKITYSNDNIPEDIDVTWREDPSTGEDAGAFKEFYEDASYFTGLGTWAEYLVIHKEQNTYLLNGVGSTSDEWELKPYSEYTVPSQHSFVVANNSYLTYVPEAGGIYPILNRTLYNTTYQGSELSFKIKDSFNYLDIDRYNEIYATYNPRRKQILFYMPMTDNINSDGDYNGSGECFIYDIQTKTWLFRKVPQYVTSAFKFENETYIGTRDGLVLQEFKGKTFNGEPIDFYYLTPPFIWGGGTNKSTTKEFRVKMLNSSANHFYVQSFKDGNLEAKEKRLIKNVSDNLGGLIWDIGFNYPDYQDGYIIKFNDWNPDNFHLENGHYVINKVGATLYHYVVDGTHYYTKQQITTSSINIPVYYDTDLTQFAGYNQYLYDITDTQQSGYSPITTYETRTAYAWIPRNTTEYCYKYGNYYAWVKVNDTSGRCITNLVSTQETIYTTNYYAFYGVDQNGRNNGYTLYVNSEQTANSIVNGTTATIPFYMRNGSEYSHYYNLNGTNLEITGGYGFAYGQIGTGYGIGCYYSGVPFLTFSYSLTQFTDLRLYRNPNADGKTPATTTVEKPQGISPLSITKSYTQSGDTITINVVGVGNITLSRYEAGDRGTNSGSLVYTKSESPVVNVDYGYSNTNLTNQIGLVTAKTDNSITIDTTKYERYGQSDTTYSESVIKYRRPLLNDDTLQGTVDGTRPVYDYPERPTEDKIKSLTDTVWDYSDATEYYEADLPSGYKTYESIPDNLKGDAWLQEGYQTKRILLPNQYFETVQFKFSGSGDDDSICISGFEVDGIQLAETPWS